MELASFATSFRHFLGTKVISVSPTLLERNKIKKPIIKPITKVEIPDTSVETVLMT